MEKDKEKQENSRGALENIKPIASVTVISDVRFRFRRNDYSINRVENQRQKYAENLDEKQVRNVMNVLHGIVKYFVAAHRLGICEHMSEKKQSQRHDAGNLVQFSEQKSFAESYRHLYFSL